MFLTIVANPDTDEQLLSEDLEISSVNRAEGIKGKEALQKMLKIGFIGQRTFSLEQLTLLKSNF